MRPEREPENRACCPPAVGEMLIDPCGYGVPAARSPVRLFQTVKDVPVADLRRNVVVLAKLATLLKIPVITTASVPEGPNGPIMPEIEEVAPQRT